MEWTIGAIGAAIVAAAIAFLLFEAIAVDKSPPDVQVSLQSTLPRQNGFLVKIRAENIGGEPAAHVSITAELIQEEKVVETREMEFEHLPPHSKREAGFFFVRDPRLLEIRLRARGYREP